MAVVARLEHTPQGSIQPLLEAIVPVADEHPELKPLVRDAVRRQSRGFKLAWNSYCQRRLRINRSYYTPVDLQV